MSIVCLKIIIHIIFVIHYLLVHLDVLSLRPQTNTTSASARESIIIHSQPPAEQAHYNKQWQTVTWRQDLKSCSTTPNMVYRPRPQQLTTWEEISNYPMSHHPQSGARYQLTACKLWLGKVKKVKCPLTHTCILNCVQRDNEWKCWYFLKIESCRKVLWLFSKKKLYL